MTEAAPTGPGWYPDEQDASLIRWWDGRAWTGHVQPYTGERTPIVVPPVAEVDRQRALRSRVADAVARGWSVEYETPEKVILAKPIRMSVLLNLAGVILTGGLWLIYVIIRAASPRFHRVTLTVDERGQVQTH